MPNEETMNSTLPEDIAPFLIAAAQEFRAAMQAADYQAEAIAAGQAMHTDEPGYTVQETK